MALKSLIAYDKQFIDHNYESANEPKDSGKGLNAIKDMGKFLSEIEKQKEEIANTKFKHKVL